MSYSPARLDGKFDADMPDDPPTPSWFPGLTDAEKAEQLIARYRERATHTQDARLAAEDKALAAYRHRIDEKIAEGRRRFDTVHDNVHEEVKVVASNRQPRTAISMDDEQPTTETPRPAKRRTRKARSVWPRYMALGVCAMVMGTSLGYGLAQKDQITKLFAATSEAARAKIALLSQPLPQQSAEVTTSGSSVAPQQTAEAQPTLQPAVMTEPAQVAPIPALKLADATQNQHTATALPDPISPGDNFVNKADALMAQGDVASARQLYLQADGMGNPKGTFGVAKSYDPKVFAQLNITGLQPDASKAAEWYKKAADHGVTAQ